MLHVENNLINKLENKHLGKHCIILTCGPSLKTIPVATLENFIQNKIVIAIKQAFKLVPDHTHYHLVNDIHYTDYFYNKRPIILYLNTNFVNPPVSDYDMKFTFEDKNLDLNKSLAKDKDFSQWTFKKRKYKRKYGPGIMYDFAFFLAVHLGVSKITTLGWDIKDVQNHFYSSEEMKIYPDRRPCLPSVEEEKLISSSTEDLYNWLKSINIELEIGTQGCAASSIIPRNIL